MSHFWPLDTFRVTEEDTKKTEMFKTEATRRKDSQVASTSSFKEFIESLQLQVQTTLMNEEQRARVLQMTHKTNQFNLTTKRLHAIPEGVDTYVTLVSDKYGDYGLVGVSFVRETEEVLTLALTLSPNPNLTITLILTLTRTRT